MLNAGLLVGCLPLGPFFQRGGLALLMIMVSIIGPAILPLVLFGTRRMGVAPVGWSWQDPLGTLLMLAMTFWLPYALSVLILAPPRSNRFLPFRLTMMVLWLAGMAATLFEYLAGGGSNRQYLDLWLMGGTLVLLFFLQVSECMSDSLSPRVRQRVPRSFLGRLLAFPFFTGGINGTVWVLLLFAGYGLFLTLFQFGVWVDGEFRETLGMVLYAMCYILTASWLSRRLPERWRQGAATPWLLTLYFVAAAAFIPALYDILQERHNLSFKPEIEFGNLFFAFRWQGEYAMPHIRMAAAWFTVLAVPTLIRTLKAFEQFQRSSEEAARPQP